LVDIVIDAIVTSTQGVPPPVTSMAMVLPLPKVDIAPWPTILRILEPLGVAEPVFPSNVVDDPAVEEIVMVPGPLVTVIPDPAVIVLNTGAPPVTPMMVCPLVAGPNRRNGEDPLVTSKEFAAGLVSPVPPLAGDTVVILMVTVLPLPEVAIPVLEPTILRILEPLGVAEPVFPSNVVDDPAVEEIVMVPGPLVTVIPDPAVIVLNTGAPPVTPMMVCPLVAGAIVASGSQPLPKSKAFEGGQERPVPP
jgi:DNA-directed RNA polymerase subunit H (RpoH/RPB5)